MEATTQNYANHRRLIWGYHGLLFLSILAGLIGSMINLSNSDHSNLYSSSLIVLLFIIVMAMFFFARIFALRAQDRAIRAEENFRHYILTGKPLDHRLRIRQIIALRFAEDEEFPALATKAVTEDMRPDVIKRAIQQWKADHHRA